MKYFLIAIAILFAATLPLGAQNVPQLEKTQKKVQTDRTTNYDANYLSSLARAFIDKDGHLVCRAQQNGSTLDLIFGKETATYHTTLRITAPTANRTITLADATGTVGSTRASATLTAGATPSFAPGATINQYLLTPAQAETIAGVTTNCVAGQTYSLLITTSGTTTYTITFGSNFTTIGTLETGTTSGVVYSMEFVYDGTAFREIVRKRLASPALTVPVVVTTSTLPYAEGATFYSFTPTSSENLAVNVAGRAGAEFTLQIIGDNSTAYTTTFTTNTKISATLATGASGATSSMIHFVSDGTNWRETARLTALAR